MSKVKKFKGVWVRNDIDIDRTMVNDCLNHYSHFTLDENSVVMDFGANIGGFASMALNAPIKEYVAFEPDENNFEMLTMNSNGDSRAKLFNGVVSLSNDNEISFYQNNSKRYVCSGSINSKGRKNEYKVKNWNIDDILNKYKPTQLKIDIEGAEIDWLKTNRGKFPEFIKEVAIELHGSKGCEFFDTQCYKNLLEDFDPIEVVPQSGFKGDHSNQTIFENMNLVIDGNLFGIDIFLRRKK